MPYGTVNADLMTTSDGVSSAGLYGFKNRLINGSFSIAQRSTSATITAGSTIAAGYSTVDRWYVYCTGANVTAAQVAGVAPELHQLQITGASSVTAIGVGQRIEAANSADLAGTTCTLSANISNSLLTTVTWTAYYADTADTFGTLASPTRTQIATGTFTVTSTNTRYSANIAIPSAATTGIEIVFTVGAQTSGTWKLDNIQLEEGATATSYDIRSIGTDLALAQRYYYRISPAAVDRVIGIGFNSGTASAQFTIAFPTTMRVRPTALEQTGTPSNYSVFTQGGEVVGSAGPAIGTFSTDQTGSFSLTVASGLTAGQGVYCITNSTGAYLGWSAEL
jgi:hypothetical protein